MEIDGAVYKADRDIKYVCNCPHCQQYLTILPLKSGEYTQGARARSCRYVQMSIFKLSLYGKYHFAVMSLSCHSDLRPILRVQVTMQSAVPCVQGFPDPPKLKRRVV